MAAAVPKVTLNSGFEMPTLGFGTATMDRLPSDRLTEIFLDGIRAGYRHFDTAALYGTEKPLGDAIAEAIRLGLVRSREEVFVTSKLWCDDAAADLVLPALRTSLENLGLGYLDSYLIHFPVRTKEFVFPFVDVEHLPFDMKSTWAAMEECEHLGLVKSIGVSNFSSKKLSDLLSSARIPPAINQVEMNPVWDQKKLRGVCKERGVHISAYSPLGGNGVPWGTTAVMDCLVLKKIAQKNEKTVAQICLRWLHEQGVSIIVKSFSKERMKENLQMFDWELNEEDRNKISEIPQMRGCPADVFISPNGTYKTLEELWDGEI